MRSPRTPAAVLVVALALLPAAAPAALSDRIERALRDATVLVGSECSGVLADGPDFVFTAASCVRGAEAVEVTFATGEDTTAYVAAVDRATDQALLLLETPAPLAPLPLARRRPIAGTILYFAGDPRAARFREVKLHGVGRWPPLPLLQQALFTTIAGAPADIGAPIVNTAGRVVGLVHGGARYDVATPASGLRRLIDKLLTAEARPPVAAD